MKFIKYEDGMYVRYINMQHIVAMAQIDSKLLVELTTGVNITIYDYRFTILDDDVLCDTLENKNPDKHPDLVYVLELLELLEQLKQLKSIL